MLNNNKLVSRFVKIGKCYLDRYPSWLVLVFVNHHNFIKMHLNMNDLKKVSFTFRISYTHSGID